MKRFSPLLERTARALDLPAAETDEIIAELRGDAEDLFAHLRDRGVAADVAVREVEQWLMARPESVRQLREIHLPPHVRWAERLSRGRLAPRTPLILAGVASMLLFASMGLLPGAALGQAPAWSLWGLGAAGAWALVLTGERLVGLWLRTEARDQRRRGMGTLVVLLMASATVSLLGAAWTLAAPLPDGDPTSGNWQALASAFALLAVGLAVSFLSAVAWLTLEARVRWMERAERKEGAVRP